MTRLRNTVLLGTLLVCSMTALGLDTKQPRIGFLYPAGGQQGTTVSITAGGQLLRGASGVYVSGEGVSAKVVKYIRPFRNLNGDQRKEVQRQMREAWDNRIAELSPKVRAELYPTRSRKKKNRGKSTSAKPAPTKKEDEKTPVKLPAHPLLDNLQDKSLRELAHTAYYMYFPRGKLQMNRQLAEVALLEITIAANARPGPRELRIKTATGLTNPIIFRIGTFREMRELEPNDGNIFVINNFQGPGNFSRPAMQSILESKPFTPPVVLNGQIMPGDVDRFRFRAKGGQALVIETQARDLIPYLADAVPGWFQATVTVTNAAGNEVAFADDYRFNPDPVLFYKVPRDGLYTVEIRDAIYRGRQDFVYRISIGEQPFITQMFPLGGEESVKTTATISGWNLQETTLILDTKQGEHAIRQAVYSKSGHISNRVPYRVDTLPDCNEAESNNTLKDAQKIELGTIINGRIDKPEDRDIFRFTGRSGQTVVAEVYARRLHSPLDALLRLTDASGKTVAWNDDYIIKDAHLHKNTAGLMTHHADPYVMAKLPADGIYFITLTDVENHGGPAYAYRLRISLPRPDFALRMTPSSITAPAGAVVPVEVYALRKDGFKGPIEVVLKESGTGFRISGGIIPAGCGKIRMTLKSPDKPSPEPLGLKLEGRAEIGNKRVNRPVVAADDTMQAFLYRHLVPAEELWVWVQKSRWRMPPVALAGSSPVKIPAGGSVRVRFKTEKRSFLKEIQMKLLDPPAGITLGDVTVVPDGLECVLRADKETVQVGLESNLIIETIREHYPKGKDGKKAKKKRRNSMGVIPAIPIQIVNEQHKEATNTP